MPAISTPDLKSMIERNEEIVLINTLPAEQFEETKLPNAVNIPQEQEDFVEQVEQRVDGKADKIVLYCASIDCHSSTEAAKKLDQAGFTNVYDYRGGAKAWEHDEAEQAATRAG